MTPEALGSIQAKVNLVFPKPPQAQSSSFERQVVLEELAYEVPALLTALEKADRRADECEALVSSIAIERMELESEVEAANARAEAAEKEMRRCITPESWESFKVKYQAAHAKLLAVEAALVPTNEGPYAMLDRVAAAILTHKSNT